MGLWAAVSLISGAERPHLLNLKPGGDDDCFVAVAALRSHASLVSARRLGAALRAARTHDDASLVAMSRRSDGWWHPDELAAFEQGAHALDDASVLAVCRLYGLRGCKLADAENSALLVDRSTASDVVWEDVAEVDGDLWLTAQRLAAFGAILGVDLSHADTVRLAEALDESEADTHAAVVEAAQSSTASAVAEAVGARVVVPITGVLVAHTSMGSVVLGRPAGRRGRPTRTVPGAAPLRSLRAAAISRSATSC